VRNSKIVAAFAAIALALTATGALGAPAKSRMRLRNAQLSPHAFKAVDDVIAQGKQANDALTRALRSERLTPAKYALARARTLFHLGAVRNQYGDVDRPGPRDATMILRDLALAKRELSGSERKQADTLLARPSQGSADPQDDGWQNGAAEKIACTTNFCFHWVETTSDAVTTGDANANGFPDYIDQAAAVFENVRSVIHSPPLSFRVPKSDQTSNPNGGNAKVDVYFTDTGAEGNYGYCTSDDPNLDNLGAAYPYYDVSGYCVLDNDFDEDQFDTGVSGLPALQVTAAHEYFHVVQYAYDIAEDKWLMEGSATWMEDVVYDNVNDYYQYLDYSQMGQPGIPLDFSSTQDNPVSQSKYGAFLWFRFLQDHVLTDVNGQPTVAFMQQIWQNADSTGGSSRDQYSMQAVKSMMAARQVDFATAYTTFGVANLFPASFYEEGAAYAQEAGPSGLTSSLPTRKGKNKKLLKGFLDHLTTAYVQFKPGRLARAGSTLRLSVDAPDPGRTQGGTGSLIVLYANQPGTYEPFTLNSSGDANITTAFGKGTIASVIVVLSNASTSYTCFQSQPFSCQGRPTYDDLPFAIAARIVR
jgi:hypothetical protein